MKRKAGSREHRAGSQEQGARAGSQTSSSLLPARSSLLPAPCSLLSINSAAMDEIHGHMNETDGKKTTPAQKRTRVLRSLADWQDNIKALSSPVTPTQSTGCPAGYPGYPADDEETRESTDMDWKDIDLDGLKKNRPELLTELQESSDTRSADARSADGTSAGDELKALQEELKTLKAEQVRSRTPGGDRRRVEDRGSRSGRQNPMQPGLHGGPLCDGRPRQAEGQDRRSQGLGRGAAGRS